MTQTSANTPLEAAMATPTDRVVHPGVDFSDLPSNGLRILLVGFGKAGGRFYRALRYIQKQTDAVQLVGVCDTNGERFSQVDDPTIHLFTDIHAALADLEPDVVCVCVNEVGHFDVLMAIAGSPSVQTVLSEKPFTENLGQAESVLKELGERFVCVNYVERYSPMVEAYQEWSTFHGAEVTRAEFFWGKYRFMDSRPTMGVLSEISHPVDLVRFLIGADAQSPVTLHEASASRSKFSVVDRPLIDTVDVHFSIGGTPVRGHSSFLWAGRDRRVVLYGRTGLNGSLFQAVLEFDRPSWDCDSLRVMRLDESTGNRDVVLASHCTYDDFPTELRHIFKVSRFCATALRALYVEEQKSRLVLAHDALWVQSVIESIDDKVGTYRVTEF